MDAIDSTLPAGFISGNVGDAAAQRHPVYVIVVEKLRPWGLFICK
jgi:hypothetical protein